MSLEVTKKFFLGVIFELQIKLCVRGSVVELKGERSF